jgi:predicted DNA-binding transcriptional regulator AlpA
VDCIGRRIAVHSDRGFWYLEQPDRAAPINTAARQGIYMPEELLPKVDLYRLSAHIRDELASLVSEAVRAALEEQGLRKPVAPAGALRGPDAAAYLGVGRSHFYDLLKEDPELLSASFTAGRCRMWPTTALDEWMQVRRTRSAGATSESGVAGRVTSMTLAPPDGRRTTAVPLPDLHPS